MSKNIILRLKKISGGLSTFSVYDDIGTTLLSFVTKQQLIDGITISIGDNVNTLVVNALNSNKCCYKSWNIPITQLTIEEIADISTEVVNTGSIWRHLTNPTSYNNFYGCINPYIIEYPYSYEYYDEIVQNVKDYTKVYKYLPTDDGVFNINRKIQTNDDYFNQAILYNDQQSSGILELVSKPKNNMFSYMSYPVYNDHSKTILFTKRDNFYQFNTFWDTVIDKTQTLFTNSCESLSIDKVPNQGNLDYSFKAFKKAKIRGKDLKVRMILNNRSDIFLSSKFTITPSQISYI